MNAIVKTQAEIDAEVAEEAIASEGSEPVEKEVDLKEGEEWGALLDEEDSEEIKDEGKPAEEEIQPAPEAQEAEGLEEEAPKVEEPEAKELEETVAEEVPAVEEPIVPVLEEPETQKTQEELDSEIQKSREEAQNNLITRFAMSEEEGVALMQNPHEELPKLASKLFMDIFDSVLNAVHQQVPGIVEQTNRVIQQKQQAEDAFFSAWPELNKPEYRGMVEQVGRTFSQMNPGATQDQYIKVVGAQAWVALQLPVDQLLKKTQPEAVPAATPPPVQQGRVPASPGNAPATPPASTPANNQFEQLSEEFLQDDM